MAGGKVSYHFGEQHVGQFPHFSKGQPAGVVQLLTINTT